MPTSYVTTRQLATRRRQYEVGDLVTLANLDADERLDAVASGAVVPARFVGTAAEIARRTDVPGPGVQVYEDDTRVLRIGDGVTAPGSLPAALSGTYVSQSASRMLLGGHRWAFFGDSITNGSGASNAIYAWPALAIDMLGAAARLDYVEAGTSGYRAYDVLNYMPTVFSTYSDIGGVALLIGTNDSNNGTPISISTFGARITAIHQLCKARGIPLVLGTVPPKGSTATGSASRLAILGYNAWIRRYAAANHIEVAEVFGALADGTTGDIVSTYNADDVHPNNAGHLRIAQAFAKAMLRTTGPQQAYYHHSGFTGYSLIANPMMTGAIGAGQPTGWFEQPGGSGNAATYTTVADTTGTLVGPAQWMEMDVTGTAVRRMATAVDFTGVSVGDVVALSGLIHVEDFSGTYEADTASHATSVVGDLRNQSPSTIKTLCEYNTGIDLGTRILASGNRLWQLGPFLAPITVPASTTDFNMWISVTAPSGKRYKVRASGFDVINLTALGLATAYGGQKGSNVSIDGPAGAGPV
jgi:lysophospholipase L1-like esterase